jgi:hypothetical protein
VPRGRKSAAPQLSPGQASYVLDRLVRDRRISSGELSRYVGEMRTEIDELERRLESLRSAVGTVSGKVGRPPGRPGRPPKQQPEASRPVRRRRRRAITPEQAQSRVLQGRYLGLIRQIPAGRRVRYARLAKEKGREAAIKEMQGELKK